MNQADLRSVHQYCTRNRELLDRSDRAGCFYCGAVFRPAEVEEWIDELPTIVGEFADGITALCPRCGIDAVLPSAAPIELSNRLLDEMHHHWFEK